MKGMKLNSLGVVAKIGSNVSSENIKTKLKTWWSIDATDEDVTEILKMYDNGKGWPLDYSISEVISKNHTVIGWTSHGHCGEDVPLWTYGPDRPVGHMDNTEIASNIAEKMWLDLNETGKRLFVNVGEVYSRDNGDGKIDKNEYLVDFTNSSNPVLKIGNAELPVSKNILVKDGVTHELKGIVVYVPETGKVYVPEEVLSLV